MKSNLLRSFIGGMITFSRTESSQEIYRTIGGKSPIVGHTKSLVKKLQKRFGENVIVDFAMRYTPPFANEVIDRLNKIEDLEKIKIRCPHLMDNSFKVHLISSFDQILEYCLI